MQQNFIILADHASLHPDNTLTIVRSGISEVRGEAPVRFRGFAVAWMRSSVEAPPAAASIRVLSDDGKLLRSVAFEPPSRAVASMATNCYVAKLDVALPAYGSYRVVLTHDEQERASTTLLAKPNTVEVDA